MIQTKDLKSVDSKTTFGKIFEYCKNSNQDCLNCEYRAVCFYWQRCGMPAPYQYPDKDIIYNYVIKEVDELAKRLKKEE